MITLGWLAVVHLVSLLMGLGVASRCRFLRDSGWAVLLAPVVGQVCFILLAFRLSTLSLTGSRAALGAFGLLSVLTLVSLRPAREAWRRFWAARDLRRLLLVCGATQVLLCLPALAIGIDTYNGYGNLDAWYYTVDSYLLKDLPFSTAVAPSPFSAHLHTISPETRVGPQFAQILLTLLFQRDDVVAYNLILASFIPLIAIGAAFVCREVLALEHRFVLLGIVLVMVHSSLELVYCYQHLGHVFSLAVIPLAISVSFLALTRGGGDRLFLGALLGVGCLFGYWPSSPLCAGPVALIAVAALLGRGTSWRRLGLYAAAVAGIALATSADVTAQFASMILHSQRFVTRNDPVMVAFNPYLTEDLLPIATGLVDSGSLSGMWTRVAPEFYPRLWLRLGLYHAAALAVLAVMALGVVAEWRRRRWLIPAAMAVGLGLVLMVLRGEYGYGLYKLVSWTHVMAALSLLLGTVQLLQHRRLLLRVLGALVVLVHVWLNVATASYYMRLSISVTTGQFVTLQNFSGNADWKRLESWAQAHADAPILMGFHQHVAQYWASFRLRHVQYATLVPQDTLGGVTIPQKIHNRAVQEVRDPTPITTLDYEQIARCGYFLDWSGLPDVTRDGIVATPLAANDTFKLYAMKDATRILSLYDGWNALENSDPVGHVGPFRWMRRDGSLLLFRYPRRPIRMVLGLTVGFGNKHLERTLRVSHHGRVLLDATISGSGRIVSDAFTPANDADLLDIHVADDIHPTPRKFTLWNKWVDQDPRLLSIGVYDVRMIEEAELTRALRPAKKRYGPQQIRDSLVYNGVYSDGWLAPHFSLTVPSGAFRQLRVNGSLVRLGGQDLPMRIRLRAASQPIGEAVIESYGDFSVEIPIPRSADAVLMPLELDFDHYLEVETSYTKNDDLRRISARLTSIELVASEEARAEPGSEP